MSKRRSFSGPGPCIHHWGIEVEDRDSYVTKIKANGGTIISEPGEGALKFRAPDGTVAEIVGAGRYKKKTAAGRPPERNSKRAYLVRLTPNSVRQNGLGSAVTCQKET